MSTKTILGLAAAGLLAAAAPSFAGNDAVLQLTCKLAAKEFAGPVEVINTTGKVLKKGTKIRVVAYTAYGKEVETIVLKADLAPNAAPVKGAKIYQNVSTGCTASVFTGKLKLDIKPRA
jgi:hypothetical protein